MASSPNCFNTTQDRADSSAELLKERRDYLPHNNAVLLKVTNSGSLLGLSPGDLSEFKRSNACKNTDIKWCKYRVADCTNKKKLPLDKLCRKKEQNVLVYDLTGVASMLLCNQS